MKFKFQPTLKNESHELFITTTNKIGMRHHMMMLVCIKTNGSFVLDHQYPPALGVYRASPEQHKTEYKQSQIGIKFSINGNFVYFAKFAKFQNE